MHVFASNPKSSGCVFLLSVVLVLVVPVGGGFGGDVDDTFLISVASRTADVQDLITLENSAVNFAELHLVQQGMPVFCCQKKAPKRNNTPMTGFFLLRRCRNLTQHEGSIGLTTLPSSPTSPPND